MPRDPSRKRPSPSKSRRALAGSVLRHLFAILAVLLAVGCAGGGCSGCACAGMTPLPNGFESNKRIENAGAVRLTQSGVEFLEANVGKLAGSLIGGNGQGGVLTFEVPSTSGDFSGIFKYDLCPGGADPNANPPKCVAEIDIGNAKLNIDPAAPHNLKITGPLPLRLRNLPIKGTIPIPVLPDINFTVSAVLENGGDTCPGGNQEFANIDLDVDVTIEVNQNENQARYGYSRVGVKINVDKNDIKDALGICPNNFGTDILEGIVNLVSDQLIGPLTGTIQEQVDEQLCLKANPELTPSCPNGTSDVDGICRYATNECASIILGADGNINLSGMLASISPGTKGAFDFLFAAGGPSKRDDNSNYSWGDLNPVAGGATLGFYGGVEPTPFSKCVKMSNMDLPTGIPIPTELFGNTVPDWPAATPGPHLGIALSERFANYALNGLYNSGFLCIGISTESVGQLNSGLLGLLAGSLKDLGLQREAQQIAIVIRPSSAPSITFGNGTSIDTEPTVRVGLKQAAFDFYMFSLDRFIRFMTVTFDLDVPVNLVVTPEGLQPVLTKLGVTNGKVTNSDLLREDPELLAASLGDLIAGQVGQLVGGGISPIDLSDSLSSVGLQLIIPESVEGKGSPGLRKLTKVNDNYLGIFASLGVAGAPVMKADTGASLNGKTVDPNGLKISTIRPDNAPRLRLHATSSLDDGAHEVEWQYRLDKGFWSPFTKQRFIDIQDGWLRTPGKHVVQVRSRVVGEPLSLDATPAEVEVVIDAEPPSIKVGAIEDGKVAIVVKDRVSEGRSLVRFKLDDGAFSDWKPASELATLDVGDAEEITIEAKDEEGNVGTAKQALIRGRITGAAEGCGCAVAGADSTPKSSLWLLGIALAGIGARLSRLLRRDARVEAPRTSGTSGASRTSGAPKPRSAKRTLGAHGIAIPLAAMAIASSWAGCNCGDETSPVSTGTTTGTTGGCADCTKLVPGLIGAYTSATVGDDTVWVAGYSEANWDDGYTWGDLVVGKWNGTNVDWTSVDGVPSEPAVDPTSYDVNGFRGGQTEAGDDVGLWTSIAADSAGLPAVAYYDRTNKALKFAKYDGTTWSVHTVEGKAGADIGRYAKLVALNGGFTIAYLSLEGGGENGGLLSKVRVATSKTEAPSATEWAFEDAAVDPNTPCRASFCGSGAACLAETQRCAPTLPDSSCSPACASGSACIDSAGSATCAEEMDPNRIDAYPEAVGDYISVAVDPKGTIGIVYYDRPRGNLMMASRSSGQWATTLLDGADVNGNDTGDMGIGATLAIDASNDWHVAYVDGNAEGLRYMKIIGGASPTAPEIVDDGLSLDGAPFDDGLHLVGDDANISVSPGGDVRISYQDATAGKLRYAIGAPSADAHTWTVKAIEQPGFAGAFSSVIEVDGSLKIVNWWRKGGGTVEGNVAIVSP